MNKRPSFKNISIRNIDCVAGMKRITSLSVDVVFADPPYNMSHSKLENRKSHTGGAFFKVHERWDQLSVSDYSTFTDAWIGQAERIMKLGGSIFVCASQHNLGVVLTSLEKNNLSVKNIIVWEKPNAMPNLTRRTLTHSVEFVVWSVKGKGWKFNYEELRQLNPDRQKDGQPKMLRDVWRFPVVQGAERLRGMHGRALHPTQKPEALVSRCIIAASNQGDLVVDPFLGSGTTGVVCAEMGRCFVGFELEEKYVKAARSRLASRLKSIPSPSSGGTPSSPNERGTGPSARRLTR